MSLERSQASCFVDNDLWGNSEWLATSFRCHPLGDAPPVMGIVFADHEKGLELFAAWTNDWGNQDPENAIRIAVIEGDISGQMPGYTVRLSANAPDADRGQVQRMHPSPETEAMLAEFKAQYLQHGEFLLCPVVQKDGQLWFDANSGIIKHRIEFRNAEDISPDDPDAVVLKPTEEETTLLKMLNEQADGPRGKG